MNAQGLGSSSKESQRREDQSSNHSILSRQNQYAHVYATYVSVVVEFCCVPMCLGHVISSSGKKSFQGTKELKSTSCFPQTVLHYNLHTGWVEVISLFVCLFLLGSKKVANITAKQYRFLSTRHFQLTWQLDVQKAPLTHQTLCLLRQYPKGLGQALVKLMESEKPVPDLRSMPNIDPSQSNIELFQSQPMGDVWWDADLPATFFYLYQNKHMEMPSEWKPVMHQFAEELSNVTWFGNPCTHKTPILLVLDSVGRGHGCPSLTDRSWCLRPPRFHLRRALRSILVCLATDGRKVALRSSKFKI